MKTRAEWFGGQWKRLQESNYYNLDHGSYHEYWRNSTFVVMRVTPSVEESFCRIYFIRNGEESAMEFFTETDTLAEAKFIASGFTPD